MEEEDDSSSFATNSSYIRSWLAGEHYYFRSALWRKRRNKSDDEFDEYVQSVFFPEITTTTTTTSTTWTRTEADHSEINDEDLSTNDEDDEDEEDDDDCSASSSTLPSHLQKNKPPNSITVQVLALPPSASHETTTTLQPIIMQPSQNQRMSLLQVKRTLHFTETTNDGT